MRFIHYGFDRLDKSRIKPIKNEPMWNKPAGGLWASPVGAPFGWKEWCEEEEFFLEKLETFCTFSLREDTRIYSIHTKEDVDAMPRQSRTLPFPRAHAIDFEKMLADGVDVIQFNLSQNWMLQFELNGWDCDSILVLNPGVIVEELPPYRSVPFAPNG